MKNYFETESRVDASKTDTMFSLSVIGALELIEDAETMHTDEMHVDAPTMRKTDNAFWVITRNFLHFYKAPVWQEKIIVGTYPLAPSVLRCERQNYIKDENGNLLISGKTEWCVLDGDSRKPRKIASLACYPKDMEYKTERVCYSSPSAKPPVFTDADLKFSRKAKYSDLDFNHHINNAKYVNFIFDCYPSSFWESVTLRDVEIDYLHECREGEKMSVYSAIEQNTLFFIGKTPDRSVFSAVVTIEENNQSAPEISENK